MRAPESLGPGHEAGGFDCGVAALDRWLRHARAGPARAETFVVAETGKVVGYYTLAAGTVRSAAIPLSLRLGAPEPVLKLGRLAVDRTMQGLGLGTALVMDAFVRTYAVSRHVPVAALLADPPDTGAGWLQRLGFHGLPGDPTAMYVPLGTIEALVERGRR